MSSTTAQRVLVEGPLGERVGFWLTPPDMMDDLRAEFEFDYDACPFPRPPGFDGLRETWGSRTWVNPPFPSSSATAWARKAITESSAGKLVVLILPVNRLDHVAGPLLNAGAEYRLLPPVAWRDPAGRKTRHPTAQMLFVLDGRAPHVV